MESPLKDYLHLYLPCDVLINDNVKARMTGFQHQIGDESKPVILLPDFTSRRINDWSLIKPILRKLSSMTEEEKGERSVIKTNPEDIRYLLSKGFDLFGLIESGLAIDSATIHLNESLKG